MTPLEEKTSGEGKKRKNNLEEIINVCARHLKGWLGELRRIQMLAEEIKKSLEEAAERERT